MQENHAGLAIFKLFKYADGVDIFLMIFGSICAVANGVSQPIMAILFGGVVHTFSTADHHHMLHLVSQVLQILYN